MSRRLIAVLIGVLFVLTGCGRTASTPPPATGYRLILEEGFNGGQITIRDSGSGAVLRTLPYGTPAPDWSRFYAVTRMTDSGRLDAIEPASGRTLAQINIPAGYALPVLGQGPTAGLSPDGQWIALYSQTQADGRFSTSFLVGSASLTQPLKAVHLNGDFHFDALSNDGRSLYLIQNVDGAGHYQVRLYDVASQSLTSRPIVDKREPNEPMNGLRGDSVADPHGTYVFTVYARESGPFVHALVLDQPFAWCIDLPAKSGADMVEQAHWSLVLSHDGTTLYAVNGMSGLISAMNTGNLPQGVRRGQLVLAAAPALFGGLVTSADAKGEPLGGATLSADERTLFALTDNGIAAIDASSLKVRATYLQGHVISSIRLTPDGKWLYAAELGANTVWQINPDTGAIAGSIHDVNNPWGILWVQAT